MLKACGDLELEHGRHEAAVRHFGELVGENPEEGRALASLIIALSHVDIAKAEQVGWRGKKKEESISWLFLFTVSC